MAEGPKKMPSFAIQWDGKNFKPDENPLAWHQSNDSFWTEVDRQGSDLTCIDGPCATNGPRLQKDCDPWRWDGNASTGIRGGELALSRQGVNLFWATQNTVMRFEGASRWIARSLVLFSECPERKKIETHPHGAFTFLWRLFGEMGTPPKKSKSSGRQARISLLRSFIPALSDEMVPNHDALDAACAALVAGLHHLGMTIPFGTTNDGGQIWMPEGKKLKSLLKMEDIEEVAGNV
jgi:predicted nuclease with RNAse H fold